MKKLILIAVTGVVLISCVLIGEFAVSGNSPNAVSAEVSASQSEEKVYVLSSRHGRLVVFRKGESEPFLETEAFVNTLPRADKLRLEQGIEVKGDENLRKAIEDYCS